MSLDGAKFRSQALHLPSPRLRIALLCCRSAVTSARRADTLLDAVKLHSSERMARVPDQSGYKCFSGFVVVSVSICVRWKVLQ